MIDLGLDIYRVVGREADRMGVDAYAVGGVVRDYFLQRPCTDIDVVCIGHDDGGEVHIGIELAKAVSEAVGGSKVSVFKTFGTASFILSLQDNKTTRQQDNKTSSNKNSKSRSLEVSKSKSLELEFVGARRESYSHDSRKPVVENGTLEDDQRRRDFTVNALAVCLNADRYGELMDPFGGIHDLNEGILRTPLDPDITFSDDPLRMMRAVRFASQLGFRIADDTFEAIARNAERIKIVSAERITTELNKIMLSPQPSLGLKLMQKCGLMQLILPEISALQGIETVDGRGHKDIFYHTLQVLDNVTEKSDNLWLRWSALLHDVGKPGVKHYDAKQGWTFHGHEARGAHMVKRIFKRLRLPQGAEERYVEKLVMLHMRPIVLSEEEVTDSAVRRLLFEAGDDIDDLMLLCNADITTRNEEKQRRHRANFELVKRKLVELEERDRIRNFQPPVSGEDIMTTFGIGPCREIGTIKDAIKDAILDGQIPNERDAAWQIMIRLAADLGLQPKE
ncbi:MAG: HD domain-containing protein [Bacteroidales bacterium]|nr:HD domain-containing protein [Bacteroidales bacterium]